jgi:hypothetical protein
MSKAPPGAAGLKGRIMMNRCNKYTLAQSSPSEVRGFGGLQQGTRRKLSDTKKKSRRDGVMIVFEALLGTNKTK